MMAEFPKHYQWLQDEFPTVLAAHQELGLALRQAGPLGDKEAQLVQLAGAAAIGSEGGVHSHARRAREAGAQPAEIYHALLLLTSTVGFPAVAAALAWAKEVVEKIE